MAGTPSFMAPELWEGGFVGAEADVYALAMTCWEVAEEGEFPFMGLGGFSGIREAVAAGIRPNRPSSLPDSLWKLMQQMWAQEPEDRPTAAKVVQELDRILPGLDWTPKGTGGAAVSAGNTAASTAAPAAVRGVNKANPSAAAGMEPLGKKVGGLFKKLFK